MVFNGVFCLCGSPRQIISNASSANTGQLTKRGFLTLPDVLVASGVNHCCTLLFYLCRCNAILKVVYFRQSASVSCFVILCLLPESTLIKMLESTDLLGVSTQHLNRQVNRVMTRSLLRKVCLITTFKSGHYSLLRFLKMPKELTAVFYVTPHRVSNESIIFSPKLKHLFFPLLHYF